MNKKYEVVFKGNEKVEFEENTTYKQIADHFQKYYDYDILAAKVNNAYVDLSDKINKNCEIEFYDRTSDYGLSVYSSTLQMILLYAVIRRYGYKAEITIQNSMDNGIHIVLNNINMTPEDVIKLEQEMKLVVSNDYPIETIRASRLDCIRYFKMVGKKDKANLLKYLSNNHINLYKLGILYDYLYTKTAYSTKPIDSFKLLYLNDTNFMMLLPTIKNPKETENYIHHQKLFDKFDEYTKWCNKALIKNASDLNEVVSKNQSIELINISEAHYNDQLMDIAKQIEDRKDKVKIILLAGPSSSGKTTTAKKLDIYLRSKGFYTHPIELDNYFTNLEDREIDENGNPDLESIKALDTDLFNKDLVDLLDGKEIDLPTYNFVLGKREYNGEKLKLGKNDIIIAEGIHALNPELTKLVSDDNKYKIFISPLTCLNLDSHNYIHTTDIRKIRRICRDTKSRGYSAEQTLKTWPSIRDGEFENIFKFEDDVDAIVNSSLLYEIGVLKTYVEPLLYNINEDSDQYLEALRLLKLLRNFLTIPGDDVPNDSVLREFIGGSCFYK